MKTPRLTPTTRTIRALFARSGNTCSFPGCDRQLVTERDLFVGEVAHIHAVSPGGPRFDPEQSPEDRRACSNLVLLCHDHHVEVDAYPEEYSAEIIRGYRAAHQAKYAELSDFYPSDAVVQKLAEEADAFWASVGEINREAAAELEVLLEIEEGISALDLVTALKADVDHLASFHESLDNAVNSLSQEGLKVLEELGLPTEAYLALPYYRNPLEDWNWELLNIGFPNLLIGLATKLEQLEVRCLEAELASQPDSQDLATRLEEARERFRDVVERTIMVD